MHPYVEREAAYGREMLADLTARSLASPPNSAAEADRVCSSCGVPSNTDLAAYAPSYAINEVAWIDAGSDVDLVWDAAMRIVRQAGRMGI